MEDFGKDLIVFHPISTITTLEPSFSSTIPLEPSLSSVIEGSDYDIHPSLITRKRKRPFF